MLVHIFAVACVVALCGIGGTSTALAFETSAPPESNIDPTMMRVHPMDPSDPTVFPGFWEPYEDGSWLSLELDFTIGATPVELLEAEVTYRRSDGSTIESVTVGSSALAEAVIQPTGGTFAVTGGTVTDVNGINREVLNDLVIDADGGIIAVGTSVPSVNETPNGFLVARYEADGADQDNFDGNGQLAIDFDLVPGQPVDGEAATAVVTGPSFQSTIGGFVVDEQDDSEGDLRYWAFARVDINGNFVGTFGEAGSGRAVIFDTESPGSAVTAMARFGGDVIAAGVVDVDGRPAAAIARITSAGELAWLRTAETFLPDEHGSSYAGVAIDSEDRIYAVGTHGLVPDPTDPQDLPQTLFLVRYTTDGVLDGDFAPEETPGMVEVPVAGLTQALAADIAIDSEDRIVLAANVRNLGVPTTPAVARLNSNGTLDSDFHEGEPLLLETLDSELDAPISGLRSVFTDNQDRIVGTFLGPDDPEVIGVFRLTDSGALDEDFSGGVVKYAHPDRPGLSIIPVVAKPTQGGRIIVGGHINAITTDEEDQGFALLRLLPDGRLNSTTIIPAGARVIMVLPDEALPLEDKGMPFADELPASVDINLTVSDEFDAITWTNIQPSEFSHANLPGGGSRIFPLLQPVNMVTCESDEEGDEVELQWFVSHGHEFYYMERDGRAHRTDIFVNNGTSSHDSRYSYDLDVIDQDGNRQPPGTESENECRYSWGQEIVAIAAGNIVELVRDEPDSETLGEDLDLPANKVVIDHGNGEFSTYAHFMQDSIPAELSAFPCPPTPTDPSPKCSVEQGEVIGLVGSSGTATPHLHFELGTSAGFSPIRGFPTFFNNAFVNGMLWSSGSLHSGDLVTVDAAQIGLPPNPASEAGVVNEAESNDAIADHHALRLPATVHGTISSEEAPSFAVRGDGIEDIYRVDLPATAVLSARLFGFPESHNLDLYVVDEHYNLRNPPGLGATTEESEAFEVVLDPGAYYVLVTRRDTSDTSGERSRDIPYVLSLESLLFEYEYAAKFVCGLQSDPADTRLARGHYATAINIHNPNVAAVPFTKKVALTFPPEEQAPGLVERLGRDTLKYDEALATDCPDIQARMFPDGFPEPYVEGFVIVQSPRSLDVTAVYTTMALTGSGQAGDHSSIDVEQIRERRVDPGTDLEIRKVARVEDTATTPLVSYTIFVTNHGPTAAKDLVIKDRVDAVLGTIIAIIEPNLEITHDGEWTRAELVDGSALFEARIPVLPVSETARLRFRIVATIEREIRIELIDAALVTSDNVDTNPDNNTVLVRTTISP